MGQYIDRVAACSDKIGTLRDGLLVVDKSGKCGVTHAVKARAHIVGGSIGGEDGDSLQADHGIEAVDIFETYIVVELVGVGTYVEIGINNAALHKVADAVLIEAVGEDTVFVHQIRHKDDASGLRHAACLAECLGLLLVTDEMIERSEEEGDVGCGCGDEREVTGVAFDDIGIGLTLQEYVNVASSTAFTL